MPKRRRVELVVAALAVATAAAVALLADPLPPLERATHPSAAWARGIEFAALVLVLWMALGILGFMQAKIGVGPHGVSGERAALDAISDDAVREIRDGTKSLADIVRRLVDTTESMLVAQRETSERVDELSRARLLDATGQGRLDDDMGGASALSPRSPG